jgi:hypothetical protein
MAAAVYPVRGAPEVVAPTNRINVALPFSRIQTHEPSRELGEVAAIVAELAVIVGELAPGDRTKAICERMRALSARLR